MAMSGAREKLFEAAKAGDLGFFERHALDDWDKVTDWKNREGDTAAHVAAKHGHAEFFLKLFSYNCTIINNPNRSGDGPLHCALKCGRPDFVVACVASPWPMERGEAAHCVWNGEGKSLVYLAAEKGYTEAVNSLLKTRLLDAVRGPNDSTALHVAVSIKHFAIIDALIEHDRWLAERRDRNGQTPLHLAVLLNDLELVRHLLTANPDPADILDNLGLSPFHLATMMQYLEIFQLFCQLCPTCYVSTTRRGQNGLHIAVEAKAEDTVKFILKDKKLSEQMINQTDADGNTPLHIAASNGDENMQRILLGCQAKVIPIKNINGFTFSDIAKARIKEKKERMQSKLLKAKDFQSGLLVMATLITTVTFTAAFTLPGGYKGDGQDQGMATLAGKEAFKVFLIFDTISMVCSIVATAALILFSAISSSRQEKFYVLKVAIRSIVTSIAFMLMSFTAGLWVVIGSNGKGLVILIAVVISSTPLYIVLILGHVYRATIWYEDEQ